jgi:hypothetical protein
MPRSSLLAEPNRAALGDNLDGEEDGDTDSGPLADPSHAAFCFATLLHHFDGGNDAAPIPDFDHDGHHW